MPAQGQSEDQKETCEGPVYSGYELSHKAKITAMPQVSMTTEALAHDLHGRVVLEAVLCRTGRVTDLRTIESLPYEMTEKAMEAVRKITFTPAEKDWHTVSQRMVFEFQLNQREVGIPGQDAEGRLIESLQIVGNRRLREEEILKWVQSRPTELFSQDQMTKDLETLLATGYFDKAGTRALVEEGARGGVGIIFEVQELPLISEVKFEGLTVVADSVILDALRGENIDLGKGAVCDREKVRGAIGIIRKVMEFYGQRDAKVDVYTELSTPTSVTLTFVISRP